MVGAHLPGSPWVSPDPRGFSPPEHGGCRTARASRASTTTGTRRGPPSRGRGWTTGRRCWPPTCSTTTSCSTTAPGSRCRPRRAPRRRRSWPSRCTPSRPSRRRTARWSSSASWPTPGPATRAGTPTSGSGPDPAHWDRLRAALTVERVERLLPEAAGRIVRHELPHLRAVHLVLTGLLGSGGSSNLRVDQIGKSVGEYLRAKHVPGPSPARGQGRGRAGAGALTGYPPTSTRPSCSSRT